MVSEINATTRLVVLGPRDAFREWAANSDISLRNRNLIYLHDERKGRGLVGPLYLLLPGWDGGPRTDSLVKCLRIARAVEASDADIRTWIALNRRTQPA